MQDKKSVEKAAAALRKGMVVVFPTDTVYGFLAEANNQKAVNKIYKLKERSRKKYLPFFVKDIKAAKALA